MENNDRNCGSFTTYIKWVVMVSDVNNIIFLSIFSDVSPIIVQVGKIIMATSLTNTNKGK